jgi:hypothetical protein
VVVVVSSVAVASCESGPDAGGRFEWTREPWNIDADVPVSSVEFAGRHLGIGRPGGLLVAEDGTWSPVQLPLGDGGPDPLMTRAIAASPTTVVIVGLLDQRPAAWASSDGTTWVLSDPTARSCAGLPLAMHGALWTSADGRSWEALDDSDFELGRSFSGAMEHGLVGVATRAGVVQITGRTADLGWTVWRSPLPAE